MRPLSSIGCMRVLVVEDEPLLAEAIRDGLRLEAIAADTAGDGDTALELLSVNAYDIAVLDRDIPGPSGDEIARQIVASGSGMPILMLTAADRLDDKASGFELGADDYLTKPFELQELVLRLRALDRRRAHHRPPVREIAGLRLDPFRREVYRDGRYVALTRKQFAVLEVLVAAEGGVVSAEELLERAWDENADPFTNAVRITVSALRKRLGEPWLIATVPGVGYRIDAAPGAGASGAAAMARAPGLERPPQAHPQLRRLPHGRGHPAAGDGVGVPAALRARPRPRFGAAARASPTRSDLLRRLRARGRPRRWRSCWSFGLVGGWLLAGRMLAPLDRITEATRIAADGLALAPDRAARAATTSSASSPTRSTPCSRGSRRTSPSSSGSRPTPRTSCAPRWRSPRPCSTWPARTRDRDPGELVDRLHAVNTRAIDLTEALLLLSRADQRSFTREHVDLSLLAEEAAETLLPARRAARRHDRDVRRRRPDRRLARAAAAADHEPRAQRDRPQPARAGHRAGQRPARGPDAVRADRREHRRARSARTSSPPSPSRSSAAPSASAPTTRASASAWPSSTASPRPTTAPSPSPRAPGGGLRVTVRLPKAPPPAAG